MGWRCQGLIAGRSVFCNRRGRRKRVLRLIDSQAGAARKLDVGQAPPGALFDLSLEWRSFLLEAFHRRLEVVAHQVELMAGFVGGMEGDLCGGQAEDEPAVAGVD